jgi:hypothetical protein
MKKILILGIILVILLAGIGTVSAVPVPVQNPSFEAPLVLTSQNWNTFPDGTPGLDWDVQWANDPLTFSTLTRPELANAELQKSGLFTGFNAYDGNQYAELDTDWDGPSGSVTGEPANVTMSQVIDTVAGATYQISYAQACRSDDTHIPCQIRFGWTGASSEVSDGVSTLNWVVMSFTRTATGAQTTISFTGEGAADSYGALIDAVTVEKIRDPPVIPEFPTMALPAAFIVGLIGAVLFIKSTKET